ncbi:hypothetical protein AR438_01745 [Chryseobacterium aquaticum]|uniref:Uncharacterized protein n=1 Tax=Chryseobacterium aquaticum TaxID=452084 RepID=A0A0Q3KRK3_9FLAO|nr:hypothetical protein [Chryseobacterium aquaticum]KQK26964.1 hypothetical protein AR438_01745 [Chryseobacterium aquaticum]
MIQLLLVLLGLAFGNNTANTTNCNNGNIVTSQNDPGTGFDPGSGTGGGDDGGTGGPVGGNTGQIPPPFTTP